MAVGPRRAVGVTHTAPCERCSSAVAVDVARCPECGYEPAGTWRVTGVAVLAVPLLLGSLALVAGAVGPSLAPVPQVPASTAEVFGIPGLAIATTILIAYARQDRRTATDSTVF